MARQFSSIVRLGFAVLVLLAAAPPCPGVAAPDPSAPGPLAVEQQRLREAYRAFEERMEAMGTALRAQKPESAARLQQGFKESREKLLLDRMAKLAAHLKEGKWEEAARAEAEITKEMNEILAILLGEARRELEREKEEARSLGQIADDLESLLRRGEENFEETKERAASGEAEKRRRAALEEAKAKLEDLRRKIEAAGKELEESGPEALKDPARREQKAAQAGELKAAADKAREDLTRLSETLEKGEPPAPAETKEAAKESARSVEKAAGALDEAKTRIGENKPDEAEKKSGEAAAAVEEAIKRLAEASSKEGDRQEEGKKEIAEETGKLAEEAKEAAGKLEESSKPKEAGKPKPDVAEAGKKAKESASHLEQAGEKTKQGSDPEALEEQQKALEKMREALRLVRKEEAKEEEKRLDRQRLLLKTELTHIREIHEKLRARTRAASKTAAAEPGRAERAELADLASGEADLGKRAGSLLKLAQGDSVFVAASLGKIESDLKEVAARLEKAKADAYTMEVQGDVTREIDRILAALKEEMPKHAAESSKPQEGGGKPQGGLIPPAAEFRMLRDLEREIYEKARALNTARDVMGEALSDEVHDLSLRRIKADQERVREGTRRMIQEMEKLSVGKK